jgi:6-phosphofructokinase 1
MLDPVTGRTKVRLVDVGSTHYAIARRFMLRLRRDDFDDAVKLTALAGAARLGVPEFRAQFEYLVATEPPALVL